MIRGIILAAGLSQRMGRQKLLLPFKEHTIIEEVIKNAKNSNLDEIVLIFGEPQNTFKGIAKKYNILGLYNENYQQGQSQSIIKGIESGERFEAFMFILGDQPFITIEVINKIISGHEKNPEHIIVPTHKGEKGNPVIFPQTFAKDLNLIKGDRGGRQVITKYENKVRYLEMGTDSVLFDIDKNVDYDRAKKMIEDMGADV